MSAKAALCIALRLAVTDKQNVSGLGHTDLELSAWSFVLCLGTKNKEQKTKDKVLGSHGLGFEFLGLVMRHQRVDEWVEVTFHHEIQLVNR